MKNDKESGGVVLVTSTQAGQLIDRMDLPKAKAKAKAKAKEALVTNPVPSRPRRYLLRSYKNDEGVGTLRDL
jgi:hypothetical protein